jgi:putative two-component system response regulator
MALTPRNGQTVLVVDDNPFVTSLLEHGLRAEGYRVHTAPDGAAGLRCAREQLPDLVLLDLDLPHVPGDEVCRRLKSDPATRLIPIVMITGAAAARDRIQAWDYGADDFLTKPFHMVEVTTRCRSLLRIKQLIEERDSAETVVFALARAVEAKSPYTHGHSERVTSYSLALAREAGVGAADLEVLRKGALLHDVGKISIPDAILNKPGPLTAEEFELVKEHAARGAHIVEPLGSLREAIPLIRWHHERPDGRGYPDGLKGDAIPLLVRVLSVCDVFDSLASDRPYRAPIPPAVCVDMLKDSAKGGGLDPGLVDLFARRLAWGAEPPAGGVVRPAGEIGVLPHDGA